jgi:hypothetical protein
MPCLASLGGTCGGWSLLNFLKGSNGWNVKYRIMIALIISVGAGGDTRLKLDPVGVCASSTWNESLFLFCSLFSKI